MRLKPSNVRKNKGTIECNKRTVTYDIGTAQCEDRTVKCEKKSKGTTQCDKRIVICDVGTAQCEDETVKCEKKSKETTKCEKITVTCDVGTAQCEDGTVRCEKKVTWCSRLPTSGYRTPLFMRGTVELPLIQWFGTWVVGFPLCYKRSQFLHYFLGY